MTSTSFGMQDSDLFGRDSCQENVCDPVGRVHGVQNLRVADAGGIATPEDLVQVLV